MITKISNAKLIGEKEIVENQSLYIEEGIIRAITEEQLPYDILIDAEGNYISPGFIDLHVHGGAGYDFVDGTEEAVIEACNFHCQHGTTTIFPTTLAAAYEDIVSSLEAIRRAKKSGKIHPHVGGVHMEGPYFSTKQCGAQNVKYITSPKPNEYEKILKEYGSMIKRWSFAPELEGTEDFLKKLSDYQVVPSIAHSDAKYEDVMLAYRHGCRMITHFFSCISTITRDKGFRVLGVTECGYLLRDMILEVIGDGCHVPKELFQMLYQIKGNEGVCLVTDAMRCAGSKEKVSHIGDIPCKIEHGVACLMDDSGFAGSIATTDRLVRFCVKEVGLHLCEVIPMLTSNPAKVMGIKNKGQLAVGYDADLVMFDEDIDIKRVLVAGRETL